jgi:hypothetical protein
MPDVNAYPTAPHNANAKAKASAPTGPAVDLESFSSALDKIAANRSLRGQAPTLAALVGEVERVHKLMPDEEPPGRNVRPVNASQSGESVSDGFDRAAGQASAQIRRAM